MKTNFTFSSLFVALLIATLTFSHPFVILAQQDSIEDKAKRDAEADVDKSVWRGVGILASGFILLSASFGANVGSLADPPSGLEIFSEGQVYGCCNGCGFGLGSAILFVNNYRLEVPPERLLGKSPEYVGFYTDFYKTRTRQLRRKYTAEGCAGCTGLLILVSYFINLVGTK